MRCSVGNWAGKPKFMMAAACKDTGFGQTWLRNDGIDGAMGEAELQGCDLWTLDKGSSG